MKQMTLLVLVLVVCIAVTLAAEEPGASVMAAVDSGADTHHVAAWTGFTHRWRIQNHRVNRFGSYVGNELCRETDCTYDVAHAAASGSASDDAIFSTRFVLIRAENVAFKTGKIKFILKGDEKQEITFRSALALSVSSAQFSGKDTFYAVLSGFDLVAIERAKKLGSFRVRVGTPTTAGAEKFYIPVEGSLRVECNTPECQTEEIDDQHRLKDGNHVTYELTVHVVLIAGTSQSVHFTPKPNLATAYSFLSGGTTPTSRELQESDVRTEVGGTLTKSGKGWWKEYAVLPQQIQIATRRTGDPTIPASSDHALHLLEWDAFLDRGTASDKTIEYLAKLWYKSWKVDGDIKTFEEAGTAELSIDPVIVQFRSADVIPCMRRGRIAWDVTKDAASNDAKGWSPVIMDHNSVPDCGRGI